MKHCSIRRAVGFCMALVLLGMSLGISPALANGIGELPQIDCSTARIPIVTAIYELFTGTYGYGGPAPITSKTHGAWLNLASGAADIIFLVAPTADEFDAFANEGIDIEMKVYGYDGLVFMGNAANSVDNLTSAEIRAIYSGDIFNWYQISNGPDAWMTVYIRNAESGSQRLFESLVWAGYEMPDFEYLWFREGEIDRDAALETRYYTGDNMEGTTSSVLMNDYAIGFNIMSYVDSEFLNPTGDAQREQTVRTTGDVNLRKGPGLGYGTVRSVKKGARLSYLGESVADDRSIYWHKVSDGSRDNLWVSAVYSELEGGSEVPLKLFSVNGYAPTTENFASGNYPYLTTSYVAIRADEPEGSPARMLFDWVGSDESRALIAENSTLSVAFSDSVVLVTSDRKPDSNRALLSDIEALDERLITREALYGYTQAEIAYLRQGIYALSGKVFTVPHYGTYFRSKGWYWPVGGSDAEVAKRFNEFQSANLALIVGYERELRRANANRTAPVRTLVVDPSNTYDNDAAAIQMALVAQGYLQQADCDGIYLETTADAVRAYQSDNGFMPNGEVDAELFAWLIDADPSR